jgi:hypothetical protein
MKFVRQLKALEKWQKRKLYFWTLTVLLIAVVYLYMTCSDMVRDKQYALEEWDEREDASVVVSQEFKEQCADTAIPVSVSTFIKSVDSIDIKQSQFGITFDVMFGWDMEKYPDFDMTKKFEIYNGWITDLNLLESYESEGSFFQIFQVSANVKQIFNTRRFPLSSYQLHMYLKPVQDMTKIYLVKMDDSYFGSLKQLNVAGFTMKSIQSDLYYYEDACPQRYQTSSVDNNPVIYSELLQFLELKRSTFGLYFKCIIALLGTSIWVFLSLFVCIHHRIDTMGMIPAVLFGTVSNIAVGANLVPDALETGLLEYINLWGIYTVIIVTVIIITINSIRSQHLDDKFAMFFGRILFFELLITTLAGHILIPYFAYADSTSNFFNIV